MRAVLATAAAAFLGMATGCSGQEVGRLTPVPASGVALVVTHVPGDTAEIVEGAVTARIGGSWATRDEPALDVTYRNAGTAAASIDLTQFELALRGEAAAIDTVDDVTGVDVSKPGNTAAPRALMERGSTPSPLIVPPGARRTLLVRFINFKRAGNRAKEGETLVATVPLEGKSRRLVFRCSE